MLIIALFVRNTITDMPVIGRALSPFIQKMGMAIAEEIDSETLTERVRTEVTRQQGFILPPALIGVYARKPAVN